GAHFVERPGGRHAALGGRMNQDLPDDALPVEVMRLARETAGLTVEIVASGETLRRDQRLALDGWAEADRAAQHQVGGPGRGRCAYHGMRPLIAASMQVRVGRK